jgi:hypothetical protein
MKIIFLDIDGVITSARTGWYNWDIYGINFLRWVCKNSDAKIVISSTWRFNHNKEFFQTIFGEYLHNDYMTPDLVKFEKGIYLSSSRGNEIKFWLDQHEGLIEKYLILDDDGDMLEEQLPYFIQTEPMDGLLFEHMMKIRDHFSIVEFIHEDEEIFQHSNMFGINNFIKPYINDKIKFV